MTVLSGYRPRDRAKWPPCRFCGECHYMIEDDGREDSLKIGCWCGATARVKRDDPDLVGEVAPEALR